MSNLKTRHIGFCPICEKSFKLADESKLVHHGYQRPGVGYIVGDCLAVHEEAYELSDVACHKYKALLVDNLEGAKKYLARLEAGEVSFFVVERKVGGAWNRTIEVVYIATPNGWDFVRELDNEISHTKYKIRGLTGEIARIDGWIAKWERLPVRTEQEEMDKKRAETAARKAEREAKKAAKQVKTDALKAKYARWEAEKADLMAKYKAVFIALGTQMEEAEGRHPNVAASLRTTARDRAYEMKRAAGKKSYLSFHARHLEIAEVFIALGLASRRESDGWVSYDF